MEDNIVRVIMPQLGEGVLEGTLTKWLKRAGEPVKEYEAILEINTDKVDTEIPSPAQGILREILVPEDSTIKVGDILALIETASDVSFQAGPTSGISSTEPPPRIADTGTVSTSKPQAAKAAADLPDRNIGFISPVVKRIADDHAIDLRLVTGSGAGGRITKADVLAYLDSRGDDSRGDDSRGDRAGLQSLDISDPRPIGGQSGAASLQDSTTPPSQIAPHLRLPGDELIRLSSIRRAIAEHMVFSERTSPHVTTVMEADLSRVVAHRQVNRDAFARDGVNLTFTAYFLAAASAALLANPMVNSSWSDQGIVIHHTVNLGMATSLSEGGLIVPVIKQAESLSLLGLARTINDLAERARVRQLKPDEVKGGTFTVTNHGITGSLFAAPIINQPQCAILGVGVIQKRVIVIQDSNGFDALAIRPMVYLSLTFDHRILDGAMADIFLSAVVKSLSNW